VKVFRAPILVLGLLYLCFFGCLAFSRSQLPSRVATHFNGSGQPDGWMSRDDHLRWMTLFGLGFPLLVPVLVSFSRLLPDSLYNIPNREYWLGPERRTETHSYLLRHSLWFSSLALCFVIGINFSIIHANRLPQVYLPTLAVLALAGAFLVGTAVWAISLISHFKRVT
jgi:ABC-type Fe3+ transport system permease subunit